MKIVRKIEGYIEEYNFKKTRKKKFDSILSFAKNVLEKSKENSVDCNIHPLVDLVRLLGRKIQTDNMIELVECEKRDGSIFADNICNIFFNSKSREDEYIFKSIKKVDIEKTIYLSKDLVIPYPWRKDRLIRALSFIGNDRIGGKWRQDNNHLIEVILPMSISLVHGGNHSITSGILQGEGAINTKKVYDISKVYDHVYCDGNNYIRKKDNSIISQVDNIEMAAIFEIGRLMKDNGICY